MIASSQHCCIRHNEFAMLRLWLLNEPFPLQNDFRHAVCDLPLILSRACPRLDIAVFKEDLTFIPPPLE